MPLTNTQYDQLIREYQQKQFRNRRIIDARQAELYKKLPLLRDLDEQIRSVSMQAARARIKKIGETDGETDSENSPSKSALHEQIKNLCRQKIQAMEEAGYPSDYLVPPYDCPDCQDTGYINGRRCHCFKQAAIDLIYTQSNLTDRFQSENFDLFRLDYYSREQIDPRSGKSSYEIAKEALAFCHSYVDNFDRDGGNLMLIGMPGIGKTFLSNCIANALMQKGHSVIYFTAFQLLKAFEASIFRHDEEAGRESDNIFSCDLLIIDDLGTEMNNSFTNSKFFEVVNERLLRKKSTVISSNLDMGQLRYTYSDRVYSSLASNNSFIRHYGQEIRVLKKIEQS